MSAPRQEDYVAYFGRAWLKDAIDGHRTGLRLKFRLKNEEDYEKFKSFKKHRKGKAGSGQYLLYFKSTEEESYQDPIYMLFVGWTMSSSNGCVITFETVNRYVWQKFRDARALDAGYDEMQLPLWDMVFVELDDNGDPINVAQRDKLDRMEAKRQWPKGGPQSIRAARLCNDKDFVNWLKSRKGMFVGEDPTPAQVAEWMRGTIKIDTRAQLDHDPSAFQRFQDKIILPFLAWLS